MSIVSIAANEDVKIGIEQALDWLALGDCWRDRVVAIKPNDTWDRKQDVSAVTQPDTLDAVLNYVKAGKPRRLIVTGAAGDGETLDAFERSGLIEVVRQHDVELVDMNRPPFVTIPLDHGPQTEVVCNRLVEQLEFVISLAQIKRHGCTDITLALKNVAMGWPAADHYGHPRVSIPHGNGPLSAFIIGMMRRFPIHLAINVGHPAMYDRGPIGGRTAETGLVVASRDAVAADAVGTKLLGFEPRDIRHVAGCAEAGLGEADLSRIEIVGLSLAQAQTRYDQAVAATSRAS